MEPQLQQCTIIYAIFNELITSHAQVHYAEQTRPFYFFGGRLIKGSATPDYNNLSLCKLLIPLIYVTFCNL